MSSNGDAPLLEIDHLVKYFPIKSGILIDRVVARVQAVDDVSLTVNEGETLGLVGESGCGKSTLCRTLLQLLAPTSGSVRFEGRELVGLSRREMRPIRKEMQMIFQDPYASLNPRKRVGQIVGDPLHLQGLASGNELKRQVQELLERVGLSSEHYNRYPHEFSGGQRQRIGIARAIALRPKLIVCDEPVSALDVSIQAQVVNLLEDLQSEYGIAYVFIAHDLSVVRHIADRVSVMYLGKMMELAERDVLYAAPMHPYTQALMSAVPVPDPRKEGRRDRILLTGDLPSPINPPSGCVFHTRCPKYREQLADAEKEQCRAVVPQLEEKAPGQFAACHYAEARIDLATAGIGTGSTSADSGAPSSAPAVSIEKPPDS